MLHLMLQAKLHRVKVTQAELHYEGSCAVDADFLEAAGLRPYQHVEIYNINNGQRFTTYLLEAPRCTRTISLNGAAARCAAVGDLLIVCAYAMYSDAELQEYEPVVLLFSGDNRPRRKRDIVAVQP